MTSEELLHSLKEVEEAVNTENILKIPSIDEMYSYNGEVFYDKEAPNIQTEHISFEMTERCNLRCRYCIYHEGEAGFRSFGNRDINLDTCKKAGICCQSQRKKRSTLLFTVGNLYFGLIS